MARFRSSFAQVMIKVSKYFCTTESESAIHVLAVLVLRSDHSANEHRYHDDMHKIEMGFIQ